MSDVIDLGQGFSMKFTSWAPDRSIEANAERYKDIPDVERIGILVTCRHGLQGYVALDRGDKYKQVLGSGSGAWWTVEQEDPLTISPSIDSGCCHGYIREGKWIDA